jgi:hypothetical protein
VIEGYTFAGNRASVYVAIRYSELKLQNMKRTMRRKKWLLKQKANKNSHKSANFYGNKNPFTNSLMGTCIEWLPN